MLEILILATAEQVSNSVAAKNEIYLCSTLLFENLIVFLVIKQHGAEAPKVLTLCGHFLSLFLVRLLLQ
jgi:hypothetical protein